MVKLTENKYTKKIDEPRKSYFPFKYFLEFLHSDHFNFLKFVLWIPNFRPFIFWISYFRPFIFRDILMRPIMIHITITTIIHKRLQLHRLGDTGFIYSIFPLVHGRRAGNPYADNRRAWYGLYGPSSIFISSLYIILCYMPWNML